MNKQELINKYKELWNEHSPFYEPIPYTSMVELFLKELKQLDEPQPVKVPQFVAEKIEYFKKTGDWDLFQAMDSLFGRRETSEWLEYKNNQETFARAWLDGYEVEEEKRYLIKIRATKHYIAKDGTGKIFFSLAYKERFTKKELEEAGFGWVFDCPGIEIEEVEG